MQPFSIPRKLGDLEKERARELCAANVPSTEGIDPGVIQTALDESVGALANGPLALLEQDAFDVTYIAVRGLEHVEYSSVKLLSSAMWHNLDTLVTSGLEELQAEGREKSDPVVVAHRSAIHAYVFFLHCIYEALHARMQDKHKAEALTKGAGLKKRGGKAKATANQDADYDSDAGPKKRGGKAKAAATRDADSESDTTWPYVKERILKVLGRTLSADLDAILYRSPAEKFRLVEVCVLTAVRCLEDSAIQQQETALKPCLEVLVLASTKHTNGSGCLDVAAATLFRLVMEHEHGGAVATSAAALAFDKHNNPSLYKALVAKFCETAPSGYDELAERDTKPVKWAAEMLSGFAARAPSVIHTVFSQLVLYFACTKAVMVRSNLIACMGHLLQWYKARELDEKGSKPLQTSRRNMIQMLVSRANDVAALVRKATLNTIQELASAGCWPFEYYLPAANVAVARLEDGALGAAAALNLLCTLAFNAAQQVGGRLTDNYLSGSIETFKAEMKGMQPDMVEEGQEDDDVGPQWEAGPLQGEDEADQDGAGAAGAAAPPAGPSPQDIIHPTQLDAGAAAPGATGASGMTYSQLQLWIATFKTALDVSRTLMAALPEVEALLTSDSADVTEKAIMLLTLCSKKQLQGVEEVWRRVWHLALCGTEKVRLTVLDAFYNFVLPDSGAAGGPRNAHERNQYMVHKLVAMANKVALCDMEALEELMRMAVTRGSANDSPMLGADIVRLVLANLHGQINRAVVATDALAAAEALEISRRLSLLCGMLARHVPQLVVGDMQHLVADLKRSHISLKDGMLVRNLVIILADLAPTLHAAPYRSAAGYEPASYVRQALANLISVMVSTHLPEGDGSWSAAAQAAIRAVYRLHPEPHSLMEQLLRHLAVEATGGPCPVARLERMVFTVGCIATEQLALIDSLAKRVRKERNEAEKAAAKAAEDDMEAQLGTGQALEHLLDARQEELEAKLMSSTASLVGLWGSVISALCHDVTRLALHTGLAAAAMTTLAKLMALDGNFCENNCSVFFTRLTCGNVRLRSEVRCSMLVALGDLGRRHPNIMEPWTERMFICLTDEDEEVAKTCLRILAHLILSDMTKPKGHMTQVARCLVSSSPVVRDMAVRLFNSLASKQAKGGANKVYQYLPEIISSVTRGDPMPEQDFEAMMKRLLGYIKADKLADSLMARLCERFENVVCEFATTTADGPAPAAAAGAGEAAAAAAGGAAPGGAGAGAASFEDVVREWRSIADCMALMQCTEKGLRACVERLRCYKHALGDDHVYRVFKAMSERGRRGKRTEEFKQEMVDFEARLDEAHNQLREEQLQQEAAAARAAQQAAEAEAAAAAAAEEEAAAEEQAEAADAAAPVDIAQEQQQAEQDVDMADAVDAVARELAAVRIKPDPEAEMDDGGSAALGPVGPVAGLGEDGAPDQHLATDAAEGEGTEDEELGEDGGAEDQDQGYGEEEEQGEGDGEEEEEGAALEDGAEALEGYEPEGGEEEESLGEGEVQGEGEEEEQEVALEDGAEALEGYEPEGGEEEEGRDEEEEQQRGDGEEEEQEAALENGAEDGAVYGEEIGEEKVYEDAAEAGGEEEALEQEGDGYQDADAEYEQEEGEDFEGSAGPTDMDMEDAEEDASIQGTPWELSGVIRRLQYGSAAPKSQAGTPLAGTPMAISPAPSARATSYDRPSPSLVYSDDMAWSPMPSCAPSYEPSYAPSTGAASVPSAQAPPHQENVNPATTATAAFPGFRVKPDPAAMQPQDVVLGPNMPHGAARTAPAFPGFRANPNQEAAQPQGVVLGPGNAQGVVGVRIKPDPDARGW